MNFNKHFVFHNLNTISKRVDASIDNENTLEPLFIILNKIPFSQLENNDAKRLLDSVDFKVTPEVADKIKSNHYFNKNIQAVNADNPELIDQLVLESNKMKKNDSFSTLWVNSIKSIQEMNILNNETKNIKSERRHSLSM